MQRIAALYDIHGNLPALEVVLDAVAGVGADVIVIGGDVVLGPMPRRTLDRLVALGPRVRFVRGNCDRQVVDAFDGRPPDGLPPAILEAFVWCAGQLDRSHRDVLAGFPQTLTLNVQGLGEVLFCHASPRSDEEIFTKISPAERVRPMLEGITQSIVVCGHTHMPFDRSVEGVRVVNAGSVGRPYGAAGAHWLLLGPDVCPIRTDYDFERAAGRVRETSYPDVSGFLQPHAEDEILPLFEAMSAKAS